MSAAELFHSSLGIVYHICRRYSFSLSARNICHDDALQEGLLALYLAALRYNPDRGAGFGTYAFICVRGRILGLLRKEKHTAVTVSLHAPLTEDDLTMEDLLAAPPDDLSTPEVIDFVKPLNAAARRVLSLRAQGYRQNEIAGMLGVDRIKVDGYIAKLRQKHFAEYGEGSCNAK